MRYVIPIICLLACVTFAGGAIVVGIIGQPVAVLACLFFAFVFGACFEETYPNIMDD